MIIQSRIKHKNNINLQLINKFLIYWSNFKFLQIKSKIIIFIKQKKKQNNVSKLYLNNFEI